VLPVTGGCVCLVGKRGCLRLITVYETEGADREGKERSRRRQTGRIGRRCLGGDGDLNVWYGLRMVTEELGQQDTLTSCVECEVVGA
jgi:hypothetical protein